MEKNQVKLRHDLRDASGLYVDPSTVHQSLIRNGLGGKVAVKKQFLKKKKTQSETGRYVRLHKMD